jgi:hypothetical protein
VYYSRDRERKGLSVVFLLYVKEQRGGREEEEEEEEEVEVFLCRR